MKSQKYTSYMTFSTINQNFELNSLHFQILEFGISNLSFFLIVTSTINHFDFLNLNIVTN